MGEDVTQNLRTVKNDSLSIEPNAARIEVRGEVLMQRKDFNALNARRRRRERSNS